MPFPIIALVALAGLEAGKAIMQSSAAHSKQEQINLQMQENHLQYQQKTLQNYDLLQKVLASQTAAATVRGVALNSPSLAAIAQNNYNIGMRSAKNLELEEGLLEENAKIEKGNVRKSLYAQLFGDAAEVASAYISYGANAPTKGA